MIGNAHIARSLLALVAALVSAPLAARDPVVVTGQSAQPLYQAQVDFADLDLSQSRARQTLHRRVMSAAWAVCVAAEGKSAALALGGSEGNCPNSTYRAARPQITAAIRRATSGQPHTATAMVVAASTSRR